MQPMGKNILIKRKEEEAKKGLLILPVLKGGPLLGTVLGVGERVELPLQEGDTVVVNPIGTFEVNEEKHFLVHEKDIFGKLKACSNT